MDVYEVARTAWDIHGASQRADELAAALDLVAQANPEVIVEIGCDKGGTLYAWRQVCDRVFGITIADNSFAAGGSGGPLDTHGADVLIGDSHDVASVLWLWKHLDGAQVDVLVIDGDHSYVGVQDDFDIYRRLCRRGALVLLHDIYVTSDPRCEVYKFWPELVEKYETEQIMSSSGSPLGWGVVKLP